MWFANISMSGRVVWKREHHKREDGALYGVTVGVKFSGVDEPMMVSAYKAGGGHECFAAILACPVDSQVLITGRISVTQDHSLRYVTKVLPETFDIMEQPKRRFDEEYVKSMEQRIRDLERTVAEHQR